MRLCSLALMGSLLAVGCPSTSPPEPAAKPATPKQQKAQKPPPDAHADIPKRTGAIVLDGVADEKDWRTAAVFSFASYDGRSTVTRSTTARMLWDDEALYLSFDVDDPDPFTLFSKRDDPIYDSEATEIFSAHSAAAELAEFAFDEADEATGRFSKSGDSR